MCLQPDFGASVHGFTFPTEQTLFNISSNSLMDESEIEAKYDKMRLWTVTEYFYSMFAWF